MTDTSISGRLAEALYGSFSYACFEAVEAMGACESPIEKQLGAAIVVAHILARHRLCVCSQDEVGKYFDKGMMILVPQYKWGKYRIDFAIITIDQNKPLFIECDGHDFHERTPDQAARDRSKDREIQSAGLTVFRFTGREIYRNVSGCVEQIFNHIAGVPIA